MFSRKLCFEKDNQNRIFSQILAPQPSKSTLPQFYLSKTPFAPHNALKFGELPNGRASSTISKESEDEWNNSNNRLLVFSYYV